MSEHPPDDQPAENNPHEIGPAGEAARLDEAAAVPSARPERSPKPPGPGLPEAVLWVGGFLAVHLVAGVGMFIAVLLMNTVVHGRALDGIDLENLDSELLAIALGGEQLIFVLVAMLAVWLRLGRGVRRRLSLTPIPLGHFVLLLLLVLPLSLFCGQVYEWAKSLWDELVRGLPFFELLEEINTMKGLSDIAEGMSLSMLIMIMAVAPAIGEELVFRGVIGRGLVARWGLVGGVLITALLFAGAHLHPAHAAGVIPLGIFMHVAYLATRSFWAPVMVHFLNNCWAAVVTKYGKQMGLEAVDDAVGVPVVLAAALFIFAATALIWKTRVRYELPDGRSWNPGYTTVEEPPPNLEITRRREHAGGWTIGLTAASFMLFVFLVAQALAGEGGLIAGLVF